MNIVLWLGLGSFLYVMIGVLHCLSAYAWTDDDNWIHPVPFLLWPLTMWLMIMDVGHIYIARRKAEKRREQEIR